MGRGHHSRYRGGKSVLGRISGNAYGREYRGRECPMPIETPCTKICTLHPTLHICIGCGRDLTEIERWSRLSAQERVAVMGVARQRLTQLSRATPA
jgi:predicted Fe-S protein YdhL (DUF1289 family)